MPAKPPSPLLGYNNNVRHRGKVFHIQTEDSGVRYGHVITHLFMDGGRILKSVKTSYAEYLGNARIGDIVREMMKQQHKAMFIALRDGKFDALSEATSPSGVATAAADAPNAPILGKPLTPAPPFARPTATSEEVGAREATAARPAGAASAANAPSASFADATDDAEPTPIRRSPEDLALDLDALDRAAAAASMAPPVLRSASDLPPPPANLLRERTTSGKYRITGLPPPLTPHTGDTPPPARPLSRSLPAGASRTPPQPAVSTPGEARRYAPTRPASIFGQARPQQGKSIFGEDLARDKSLDEVILSYLADDVDRDANDDKK